jgi:hypothetical protein
VPDHLIAGLVDCSGADGFYGVLSLVDILLMVVYTCLYLC